jgi:hypothetical protein
MQAPVVVVVVQWTGSLAELTPRRQHFVASRK